MNYASPYGPGMAGNEDQGFGRGLAGLLARRFPHTGGGMHPMQGNGGIVPQTGGYDAPHAQPQFGTGGGLPAQSMQPMTGGGFAPQSMAPAHTGGGFNPMAFGGAAFGGNPMHPPGLPPLPYGGQLGSLARLGAVPPGAGHFGADPLGLFGSSASDRGHYADGSAIPIGDGVRFTANRALRGGPEYGDMARRFG